MKSTSTKTSTGISRRDFLAATGAVAGSALLGGCDHVMGSMREQAYLAGRAAPTNDVPVVQTTRGAVRGVRANGVAVFRGIPFAEPPAGKLRFRAPVPRRSWDGVLDATRFGQIVPQTDESPIDTASLPKGVPQGDDSLNLNVWTPTLEKASLPVLAWIHGGSFKWGSGSIPFYDGTSFAHNGIVVVTMNYRVGAAGFLVVGDRPGSGCFGLLDQVLALEWVRDNIRAFGGDPTNVTVAGESAGGFSIGQLLGMPAAHGLFRRAIVESGGAQLHVGARPAKAIAAEVFALLGIRPDDDDAIARLTSTQILDAQRAVGAKAPSLLVSSGSPDLIPLTFGLATGPTYGTDTLPKRALDTIAEGSARGIDLLVGWNEDETSIMWPTPEIQRIVLPQAVQAASTAFAKRQPGDKVIESYRDRRKRLDLAAGLIPFGTDLVFRIPSIRLAETVQRNNPGVYMYRFGWKGKFGAVHALEVPFVFNTLAEMGQPGAMLGAVNPPQSLADSMHGAWVSFIKTGTPRHSSLPEWPRYEPARRATMHLDVVSRVIDDPDGEERRFWDGVEY